MDRIRVMQLVRAFQCGFINRLTFRRWIAIALGTGAAAETLLAACAALPVRTPPPVVAAPSTRTLFAASGDGGPQETLAEAEGTTRLATEHVSYTSLDGETLTGYLARPRDQGPQPGVVVIQEWWGLDEHILDVTRRLALAGFVALAPDLYHGVVVSEPDEARKLVMELDMEHAVAEIRQAVDFLQAREDVTGHDIGAVGFCMGGRLVLQTARVEPDLGAAVAFYGTPLALEEVEQVTAPVLGIYGAEDQGIPVEDVRTMEQALAQAGVAHEIHVYEGAPHAFFNDTRASYRPQPAQDAWQRTLDWFRAHLAA
jgi:carboxymethylenebutenolidase